MKTAAEIKFKEIIYSCFHEKLKALQFKKRANNFYRNLGEIGHIVHVQKSVYGSKNQISFTVNIGIFSSLYWMSAYNYKNVAEAPSYPTEAVCIIRKRIGQFIDGKDLWYDLNEGSNVSPLISELTEIMELKVLPFLDEVNTNDELLAYLENEAETRHMNYLRFVMYGELGIEDKLKAIYPKLLAGKSEARLKYIQAKARKYNL